MNDIARFMDIGKATVSVVTRAIPLQRARIPARDAMTPEIRAALSRAAKAWALRNPKAIARRIAAAQLASSSSFTKHELSVKAALVGLYGPLIKERVCGSWADFANERVVIEITQDICKGASDAIRRFEGRIKDKRRKLLYCYPHYALGVLRRARAADAGVEIFDLALLENAPESLGSEGPVL